MKPCRRCCCISHCLFFKHTNNDVMVDVADTRPKEVKKFRDVRPFLARHGDL